MAEAGLVCGCLKGFGAMSLRTGTRDGSREAQKGQAGCEEHPASAWVMFARAVRGKSQHSPAGTGRGAVKGDFPKARALPAQPPPLEPAPSGQPAGLKQGKLTQKTLVPGSAVATIHSQTMADTKLITGRDDELIKQLYR